MELTISPQLLKEAKRLGVTVPELVQYDAEQALVKLSNQYGGIETSFGCDGDAVAFGCQFGDDEAQFGSFLRHIIGRKADRAVRKVGAAAIKTLPGGSTAISAINAADKLTKGKKKPSIRGIVNVKGKAASVATFAVRPNVSAANAMRAADQLLGSRNIRNASRVVSNTKAMAALGFKPAQKGAQALATVSAIRQANKVPIGTPAIPQGVQPVPLRKFAANVTQAQANNLAIKKVEESRTTAKRTFWTKVKELFGFKASATVKAA